MTKVTSVSLDLFWIPGCLIYRPNHETLILIQLAKLPTEDYCDCALWMSSNHSPSDSSMPQWWSVHPPEGPRYGPPCSTRSLQRQKGIISFKWIEALWYLTPWYVSYSTETSISRMRCQMHIYCSTVLGSLGLYLLYVWRWKRSQHGTAKNHNTSPVESWMAQDYSVDFGQEEL